MQYTKMEKLENAEILAKSNLDRLQAELANAEQAAMDNPGNETLALKAATLELQIKAAQRGVKRAQEAVRIEQERLTGPEAQAAIKELEKINKEGVKLTADITKACEALHQQMGKWQALQKQSGKIARQYNQDPFDLGIAGSRLGSVKLAIDRWTQEVRSWKRNQEIMAKPNHGFVRVLPTKEVRKSKRR